MLKLEYNQLNCRGLGQVKETEETHDKSLKKIEQ